MPKAAIVQSAFDFAMREINALETRIVTAEDDADGMLWEQARQVVEQLKTTSLRQLASQWINARTGKPYKHMHVQFVAKVYSQLYSATPRPRFRDAYNTLAHARNLKLKVHHSSESVEHYTPPEIIEAVVACLGSIDLDPCSNGGKKPHVPARRHYTIKDDGLSKEWGGSVYMNPPYGDEIEAWVTKLCDEHAAGRAVEAIALLPARPDTQWFRKLRDYVCCFVEGRLTFLGNEDPAPFPSAVFYLGDDYGKFYSHFKDIGDIWQRLEPGMFGE